MVKETIYESMKVKEEVTPTTIIDMADEDQPDTIKGLYESKSDNVGENNSTIYTIVTNPDTKEKVRVWGSTVLDSLMENVVAGNDIIQIEYLGKKKNEKGSREYKDFRVSRLG